MAEVFPSPVDVPDAAPPPEPPLASWPPPGLERLQGDLGWVVSRLFTGGAIFTLPLLAALTLPQDPWSPGIFGEGWWLLVLTSLAGLLVLATAHVGLFRLLRRWASAVGRGYGASTVALVLADDRRDTGFLVQAARAYSLIPPSERQALLYGRLVRVVCLLAAGVWLSSGFLVGVLLAARGMVDEVGLVFFTVVPVAGAAVLALVVRSWENSVLARARKAWHRQPWSADLARDEIREWQETVSARPGTVGLTPSPEGPVDAARGRGLRVGAVVTAGVATLLVLAAVPLVVTAGAGPILAAFGTPNMSSMSERAARTEVLSPLRLPTDPTVTALEAGQALAALTGGVSHPEIGREPPRDHAPLFEREEDRDNPTGIPPPRWAQDLMPRLENGLEPEVIDYLRQKGAHPALAELATLGRAATLDEIGGHYRTPFPDDVGLGELRTPRYGNVRNAAYAQVGGAVADAAAGDVAGAEDRLRTVISAGLLLGGEGGTLLGNLVGFVIAGIGAEGLAGLYDATGRPGQARALRESLDRAERGAEIALAGASPRRSFRELPGTVTDSLAIRGARWESLLVLNTVGPCLNLNRAVFGPPEGHERWLEEARASLVRTEGEEELFRIARHGWWGPGSVGPTWMGRLFSTILGSGDAHTCAGAVAEVAG